MWLMGLMVLLASAQAPEPLPGWIDVQDEMGRSFRLVEVQLTLDGREVTRQVAPAGDELGPALRVYEGPLAPGLHAMNAILVYEARNRGPFTYMDQYRYRVSGEYAFVVPEQGDSAGVRVIARERRGPTVPLEDRPQLFFERAGATEMAPLPPAPQPR